MEQSNNFNYPGGGKGRRAPRFNMNFGSTPLSSLSSFFSGGGDARWKRSQGSHLYRIQVYVDKGYVLSVVANKAENTLKYISTRIYERCL